MNDFQSSANIKIYMAISCLYSVMNIFFMTFLVSYFISLSGNNIIPTALYYICFYAMVAVTFLALGPMIKCHSKIVVYRFGLVAKLLVFGVLLALGSEVNNYVIPLGLALGMIESLYSYPNNVMLSEFVENIKMIRFFGYLNGFKNIFKIVAPVALGALITFDSYFTTILVMSLITLVACILSFKLKVKAPEKERFNSRAFWQILKKSNEVKSAYCIEFLKGFIFEILDVLVLLYILLLFQTNFNLGIFNSVFAVFTMSMHFIFGRFCRYTHFKNILIVTSILTFFCTLYFVEAPYQTSFIIYNLCLVTAGQLLRNVTEINMFNVSNSPELKEVARAEYFAVRETFLNGGRILGFTLVIWAAVLGQAEYLPYVLFFLTLMIFVTSFVALGLDKKLRAREGITDALKELAQ